MITLLASIAGFISSIIPEILKIFKDNIAKKHELEILDRQIENYKRGQTKLLTNLNLSKDLNEHNVLYSTYKSGIDWIDALNSSVRPVLAYSFFIMYAGVKYLQYKTIKNTAILIEYIDILWNLEDQAIFAGIISFYFGQRMFKKLWKGKV